MVSDLPVLRLYPRSSPLLLPHLLQVSIRAKEWAVVPIQTFALKGEKVLVYDQKENAVNAMRAVHLVNSSDVVLTNGTVAIIEGSRFVAQAAFDPLLPGDDQLVRYGLDTSLSITVEQPDKESTTEVQRLEMITEEHQGQTRTTGVREWRQVLTVTHYTVKNNSNSETRTVFVDHTASNNHGGFEIVPPAPGEAVPIKTSQGFARYRLTLQPTQEAVLTVKERVVYSRRWNRAEIKDVAAGTNKVWPEGVLTADVVDAVCSYSARQDLVSLLTDMQEGEANAEVLGTWYLRPAPHGQVLAEAWANICRGKLRESTEKVLTLSREQESIDVQQNLCQDTVATIERDQARLRENLRSLEKVSGEKVRGFFLFWLRCVCLVGTRWCFSSVCIILTTSTRDLSSILFFSPAGCPLCGRL